MFIIHISMVIWFARKKLMVGGAMSSIGTSQFQGQGIKLKQGGSPDSPYLPKAVGEIVTVSFPTYKWVCVHGTLWWTAILFRVYSCLIPTG